MRRLLVCLVLLALETVAGAGSPVNKFHFAILGDRTGSARQEVYARAWAEVRKFKPAFVINVGDTIQGTNDETAEAQWREIHQFLDRYRKYPFYIVPGNHDIWGGYSSTLFAKETGHPPAYSFDYQGAHFVVLNNSRSLDLPLDQLQFLEADLKKNRERSPKFVIFHQPFWLVFLKLKNGAFPLHRLAKEYGVDYVVSGHGHQLVRMVQDGVTYLEVGSSGAKIVESFDQGSFYHWVQVRVTGPKAQVTVKELAPPYGKGRTFDVARWGENGGLAASAP